METSTSTTIDTPPVGSRLLLTWAPGSDDEPPVVVTVVPLPEPTECLPGEFDVADDEGVWTVMHMDIARGVTWVQVDEG